MYQNKTHTVLFVIKSRFPTFSRVSRHEKISVFANVNLAFLHSVGYQDVKTGQEACKISRFPTFSRVSRPIIDGENSLLISLSYI